MLCHNPLLQVSKNPSKDVLFHYSSSERWFHLIKKGKLESENTLQVSEGKEDKGTFVIESRKLILNVDDEFAFDFVF